MHRSVMKRRTWGVLICIALVGGLILGGVPDKAIAAKMTFGKWLEEWQDTKSDFENATDRKKPAKHFLGVFRKSSGVEKALKQLDAAYMAVRKETTKKSVAGFGKAIKNFEKVKNRYIKQLESALKKEGDADSAYAKGLKILKQDLKAIAATAEGQLPFYEDVLERGGLSAKSYDAAMAKMMAGAIQKGRLFAKRVMAQKTPEAQMKNFNDGIREAARDITQNLKNLVKKLDSSDRLHKRGAKLSTVLEAWGDKGRRIKDAKDVKREVKAYLQAVKGAKDWLKDYVKEYK